MKAERIRIFIIAVTACAAVMMTLNCAKSPAEGKAYVSFTMGNVAVTRGTDSRQAKIKDVLADGDRIVTGDRSFAVIQLPGGALCRIEKNTSVELSSILGGDKSIMLNKGIILSKVEKLGKGEQYRVKTPLAIAAVRGTEFMTSYDGTSAKVAVGDGKVSVSRVDTAGDNPVDEGKTVVVSDSVETRDINDAESAELEKLKPVEVIPDIENKSEEEIREEGKDLIVEEYVPSNTKLTLEQIRQKYDRIDTITLYSGKVIKGAIISRGRKFRVETPSGLLLIESKKIKQTSSN